MVKIKFMYRDDYTNGKWNTQECVVSSLDECIKIYGLDECEHKIVSIEKAVRDVKENGND